MIMSASDGWASTRGEVCGKRRGNTARSSSADHLEGEVVMENISTKLQETGRHAQKQRDVFLARAGGASRAWAMETRAASVALVEYVRSEAMGWRRYVTKRAARARVALVAAISPRGFERRVLVGVDSVLRAATTRVRGRIVMLDGASTPKRSRATANGSRTKSRAKGAAKPQLPAALAGVSRH
jgi:hypothetical protein